MMRISYRMMKKASKIKDILSLMDWRHILSVCIVGMYNVYVPHRQNRSMKLKMSRGGERHVLVQWRSLV